MANIVSVREFTQNLRKFKPGETIVVVDAVRKTIIASIRFEQKPEQIEQTIKQIYRS